MKKDIQKHKNGWKFLLVCRDLKSHLPFLSLIGAVRKDAKRLNKGPSLIVDWMNERSFSWFTLTRKWKENEKIFYIYII